MTPTEKQQQELKEAIDEQMERVTYIIDSCNSHTATIALCAIKDRITTLTTRNAELEARVKELESQNNQLTERLIDRSM
jgi:predicted nuclease with TOPRIM domain